MSLPPIYLKYIWATKTHIARWMGFIKSVKDSLTTKNSSITSLKKSSEVKCHMYYLLTHYLKALENHTHHSKSNG